MAKPVAIKKRAQIDKASQNMFIAVCGASLVLGVSIVAAIYLGKWMTFNAKVIGEKQAIIKDYENSISNLSTLSTQILELADNANLESVARGEGCVGNTEEEAGLIDLTGRLGECTALRVVPDALPSVNNQEATLASLNKVFIISSVDPGLLEPGDSYGGVMAPVDGVEVLPLSLSVDGDSSSVKTVLSNIERSIRAFDIRSATIEWSGEDNIMLRGQASAYSSTEVTAEKKQKVIMATEGAKK